jgi:hypothetical protein
MATGRGTNQNRAVIVTTRSLIPIAAALLVLVAACGGAPAATPTRSLGPGEHPLPVAKWDAGWGQTVLCAGAGFVPERRLHGSPDDPRLVWMIDAFGIRTEIGWPVGYSARFTPNLELLDNRGVVIAREDSPVLGGCPTAVVNEWSVDLATPRP